MKKITFNKVDLTLFKDYFGIITFATFALGYIGFYTYCAKYSLPFTHPEISQIVAIGILSILLILGFYIASGGALKRRTSAIQSLLLFFIANVVIGRLNPILLFLGLYLYVDDFERLFFLTRSESFSKRRKRLKKIPTTNRVWTVIITFFFFLIGLFFDYEILIAWIFIDTAIGVFKRVRYGRAEMYKISLIILLTPIFLFGFLITEFDFTLFGLSRANVILTKKDRTTFRGKLIYKDDDLLYFEDTVNTTIPSVQYILYPDMKGSIGISRDEISQYRIDTSVIVTPKRKSFIKLIFK